MLDLWKIQGKKLTSKKVKIEQIKFQIYKDIPLKRWLKKIIVFIFNRFKYQILINGRIIKVP